MAYVDSSEKTFLSTNDLSVGGANTAGYLGTSGQYLIMKMDASNPGQVVPCTAATDVSIGVNMTTPKANDYATIRLRSSRGTLPVIAGGTIAAGAAVTSNGTGQGISTTTAGNQIIGYAIYAAIAGEVLELMPSTAKY